MQPGGCRAVVLDTARNTKISTAIGSQLPNLDFRAEMWRILDDDAVLK